MFTGKLTAHLDSSITSFNRVCKSYDPDVPVEGCSVAQYVREFPQEGLGPFIAYIKSNQPYWEVDFTFSTLHPGIMKTECCRYLMEVEVMLEKSDGGREKRRSINEKSLEDDDNFFGIRGHGSCERQAIPEVESDCVTRRRESQTSVKQKAASPVKEDRLVKKRKPLRNIPDDSDDGGALFEETVGEDSVSVVDSTDNQGDSGPIGLGGASATTSIASNVGTEGIKQGIIKLGCRAAVGAVSGATSSVVQRQEGAEATSRAASGEKAFLNLRFSGLNILKGTLLGAATGGASNQPSFSAKRSRENYSNMNIEQKICLVSRSKATNAKVDFEPHQCSKKCIADFPYRTGDSKNENPMVIPILWGWQRKVTNTRKVRRPIVSYVTPCGRQFLNIDEVYQYLCVTRSQLGVDLFCFDSHVDCFYKFEPIHVLASIKDISKGNENIRLPSVNSIERRDPVFVDYCTERIARKGVDLNLDPDFLVCCDCTDDCLDKEKCQCWQLTIQATATGPGGQINRDAGYEYRRLSEFVWTGIYECNKRCKCRNTCLNRVAQWPLHMRLQLFKTESCGWGVRCLDDIPQGQFICVYVGELLNGQEADEIGNKFCDEYLAEIDLIETIERAKEGYESDVDNTSCSSITEDDCDEISDHSCELNNTARSRKVKIKSTCEKMSAVSLYPTKTKSTSGEKSPSTLELFGNDNCFLIDAKNIGNIARYFNHSCSPNIFVQNVFVDTHDLRFPWIAFFSMNHIRAGTELAWDYSYEVGSVPGKKIICHCGAKECRGRLL